MTTPQYIGTVGQLRAVLADQPDAAPILGQVAANDGKAWMMPVRVEPAKHFAWPINPIIVTLSHPQLATLPDGAFSEAP